MKHGNYKRGHYSPEINQAWSRDAQANLDATLGKAVRWIRQNKLNTPNHANED